MSLIGMASSLTAGQANTKLQFASYAVSGRAEILSFTDSYTYRGRVRMIELNGVWIMAYIEANGHSEGNQNHVNITFSNDQGTTWSAPNTYLDASSVTIFPYFGIGPDSTCNIQVLMAVGQRLIIIGHDRNVSEPDPGGHRFLPHSMIWSDDGGKTWEGPIDATNGWEGTSNLQWALYDTHVEGNNIYALYALTTGPNYDDTFNTDAKCVVVKSSDFGMSWTVINDVSQYSDITWGGGLLKLGAKYTTFMRSNAGSSVGPVISPSEDYGATWGPVNILSLADGVDQCSLKRYHDEDRIYSFGRYSNTQFLKRPAMWYSDDFGATWTYFFVTAGAFIDGGPCDALKIDDTHWYVVGQEGDFTDNKTYKYLVTGTLV